MRLGRSALAMLIGIVITVVLSLAVDEFFHLTGVYPRWNQPMNETGDNLLALTYRVIIQIFAGVVALRFAGYAPDWHAVAFGGLGLALGTAGALATGADAATYGPRWYPWALAISAVPCAVASWWLVRRRGLRSPATPTV